MEILDTWAYFTSATIIITVPTGIKFFRRLGTLHGTRINYSPSVLWALGCVFLFINGCPNGVCFLFILLLILLSMTFIM